MRILTQWFTEILVLAVGFSTFIVVLDETLEFGLVWIGASLLYLILKLLVTSAYDKKIIIARYTIEIRIIWENEWVTVVRAAILSLASAVFITSFHRQTNLSYGQIPDTLWLLFFLSVLIAIRGGVRTLVVLILLVFNIFLLFISYRDYEPGFVIIAKIFWISVLTFVVYAIVRYLSDLYADLRLLRDIEVELYQAQSDLDEKYLQRTFLSLLHRNFGYQTVNMFYISRDDAGKEILKCVEVANPNHELLKRETFDLSFGIIGHVARTGKRYIDNNVKRNSKRSPYRYHPMFASTNAELTVPIKLEENTIGVLDIQADKSSVFSMDDAAILEDVARRFSTALYFTRITYHIKELFRATYDQVRLHDSLETALQKLADAAHHHLEADLVMMYFQSADKVHGPIYSGKPVLPDKAFEVQKSEVDSFVIQLLNNPNLHEVVFDEDIQKPKYPNLFSMEQLDSPTFVERQGIKSRVTLRLIIDNQNRALLFLNYRIRRNFGLRNLDWWQANNQLLINAFQKLAIVVIENVLKRDAKLAEQRLRVARMLHDMVLSGLNRSVTLVQRIAATNLINSENSLMLEEIQSVLSETYEEVRYFESNFNEMPVADLRREIEKLAKRLMATGTHVNIEWKNEIPIRIPQNVATCLRSILREATLNATQHGKASHLQLIVNTENDELFVQLNDDGCGFEMEKVKGHENGLFYMRVEAEELGGSCMWRVSSVKAQIF